MGERLFSEQDLLAAAGVLTDPDGRILGLEGQNRLAWLTHFDAAQVERAQRILSSMGQATRELRAGWFVRAGVEDDPAFAALYEARAERALQIWRERPEEFWSKHNRATLHRLLAEHSFSPEARMHLCEASELYLECALEVPEVLFYRQVALRLVERLASEWHDDLRTPGPYSQRELMLIRALLPDRNVEQLQTARFGKEVQRLEVASARLQQDLLPYQGTANPPPEEQLEGTREAAQSQLFEPVEAYRKGLLPESVEYEKLGKAAGEAAAVLSWSYRKLEQNEAAEEWWRRALRWYPPLEDRLESGAIPRPGEERIASVHLGEQHRDELVPPPSRRRAPLFGVGVVRRRPPDGTRKETWLEAFMLLGVPVFPLRRLRLVYDEETDEAGQAQELSLHLGHHLLQAITSMLVALLLLVLGAWGWQQMAPDAVSDSAMHLEAAEAQARIDEAVERLKSLAVEEARLQGEAPSVERDERLRSLLQERADLIEKIESLESGSRLRSR